MKYQSDNTEYKDWDAEIMLFFRPFGFKWRTYTRKYEFVPALNYIDAFTEIGLGLAKKQNVFFKHVLRTLKPTMLDETNSEPNNPATPSKPGKLPSTES